MQLTRDIPDTPFEPYRLFVVANEKYARFTRFLIQSTLQACDPDDIGSIIVADIGLSADSRIELGAISDKVVFLETERTISSRRDSHSPEWIDAVSMKTKLLAQLIRQKQFPLIMLDADHIVTGEFLKGLPRKAPLVVCRRAHAISPRKDGQVLRFNGSFFVANDARALAFVGAWIARILERIENGAEVPHETPALCDVIETMASGRDYEEVVDIVYSAPNLYERGLTRLIHCKSRGALESDDFVAGRLERIQGVDLSELENRLAFKLR